jgi:hypothetical protein
MFTIAPLPETQYEGNRPSPDLDKLEIGTIIEHRSGALSVVVERQNDKTVPSLGSVRCVLIRLSGKSVGDDKLVLKGRKPTYPTREVESVWLLRNGRVNSRRFHRLDAMGEVFMHGDRDTLDNFLKNIEQTINTNRSQWGEGPVEFEGENV